MKSFLVGLIAGVSMALAASSAMAVPSATYDDTPDYATLSGYSTSTAGGTFNAGVDIYTTSSNGIILSPFPSPAYDGTGYYAAGPATQTLPNPAILTFSSLMSSFSFLWGSPDEYNTITFFNGLNPVTTLASLLPGFNYTQSGAVFVTVTGLLFDSVQFYSGSQAVEFASISAVPVPAGLPLLGAGVALLGYLGMRRKRNAATA